MIAALGVNLAILAFGHAVPGWSVSWTNGRLVVVGVEPLGRANRLGVAPGDVVVAVDHRAPLMADAGAVTSGRFDEASVMTLANAQATEESGVLHDYVGTLTIGFADAQLRIWGRVLALIGLALCVGVIAAFRSWRPTGPLHDLAVQIAAAIATPVLVFGAFQVGRPVPSVVGSLIGSASLLILIHSLSLVGRVRFRGALIGGGLLAVTALAPEALALLGISVGAASITPVLFAAAAIVSGVVAALTWRQRDPSDSIAPVEVLFAGLTVGVAWASFALSSDAGFYLPPLAIWLVIAGSAAMIAVRPLVTRAMRSRLERDIFAEAMEAQRALIAADIHDDALQDLTHLVRRLDEVGDRDNAALAREVADGLRDLTYELRLPLLDDLGAGSAIEWFVGRLGRLRGVEIQFEREERGRPPAEVELAFFRVAQEALTNAVKHGGEPVVVRYESEGTQARLCVEDAGPGITVDAHLADGRHFGLLSIRQRAETIGARLSINRRLKGGTRVEMDWRPS